MDPRRLTALVSAGALATTAAIAGVVAADPLPGGAATPEAVAAAPAADPVAELEERAGRRLARAERHLRRVAAEARSRRAAAIAAAAASARTLRDGGWAPAPDSSATAPARAPEVAVAPPAAPAVAASGSS